MSDIDDLNDGPQGVQDGDIAALLLENRDGGTDWGEIAELDGKPCSKKIANTFLLCRLLDYQILTDLAWKNGHRLVEDILGDPDDVWRAITSVSESEWNSKRKEYRLHRFPVAHSRLWRIGKRICEEYAGDARKIWERRDPLTVLEALENLGAGDQISRMIVGALLDCGQIKGGACDVKGDVHVRRVLGRTVLGKETTPERAVEIARHLHPVDPWQLDAQLWFVGKNYCRKTTPTCGQCYLAPHCAYALAEEEVRRRAVDQFHLLQTRVGDNLREIVLKVGAEGGSVTLLRERESREDWRFRMATNETALYDMLSEEDREGLEFRSQTRYVRSFQEGLRLLDRYRWFRFYPLQVHPEFLDAVLLEVSRRGGPAEKARWLERLKRG